MHTGRNVQRKMKWYKRQCWSLLKMHQCLTKLSPAGRSFNLFCEISQNLLDELARPLLQRFTVPRRCILKTLVPRCAIWKRLFSIMSNFKFDTLGMLILIHWSYCLLKERIWELLNPCLHVYDAWIKVYIYSFTVKWYI